jgi:acetyl-CoA synthetase
MSAGEGNASGTIQSVSREARSFPPPADFAARALINDAAAYEKLYSRSIDDPEGFWAETARAELTWSRDFKKVLDWKLPYSKWFEDGQINLSANCLDRHLATRGDKVALDWEGEPGDTRTLTYRELHAEVCKFANAIEGAGDRRGRPGRDLHADDSGGGGGDARVHAHRRSHTVVFGGFSAEALRDRINDCGAKLCITADGGWRRGKSVPLKANVDAALAQTPSVQSCVVARRTRESVNMQAGRDVWWDDVMNKAPADCPPASLSAEHPAVHPLHVGDDREAEGDRAHDRRLSAGRPPDHEVRVRSARQRHLLVHRRHRLGDRAQLRRLRPAVERRDQRDVRGRP